MSRRQRIGVLVLTPAILLGSLFAVYRSTRSHRELELPKTLEEYRKVLHQPDFGLLFVDFTVLKPRFGHRVNYVAFPMPRGIFGNC